MDSEKDLIEDIIDQIESDQEYCHCNICEYQLIGRSNTQEQYYKFIAKYQTKKFGFANTKTHIHSFKDLAFFNLTGYQTGKDCPHLDFVVIYDGKGLNWSLKNRMMYIEGKQEFLSVPKKKINDKSYVDEHNNYHVIVSDCGWYWTTITKEKKEFLLKTDFLSDFSHGELNKQSLEKMLSIPMTDLQSKRLIDKIEKALAETSRVK